MFNVQSKKRDNDNSKHAVTYDKLSTPRYE